MDSTTTQTTTIPGATGQESQLRGLLTQLAQQFSGQLGDLSAIAGGDLRSSEQDRAFVAQNLGLTRDITSRNLESLSEEGQARLGENFAARGVQGSSFEAVDRAILERDLQRQGGSLLDQARIDANQALQQQTLGRAGLQINANQALFSQIAGAANPVLSGLLQERLAQETTEQTESQGFGINDLAKIGGLAAGFAFPPAAAATAVASSAKRLAPGAAGGSTSLFPAFQQGLRQRD